MGFYRNVLWDCWSDPLQTIRLVSRPAAGKVIVKAVKAKATNYKACLALEVPAYIAFYKSPPEFLGDDVLTIEVKYIGGRTEIQKITVNGVGPGAEQQSDMLRFALKERAHQPIRSLRPAHSISMALDKY